MVWRERTIHCQHLKKKLKTYFERFTNHVEPKCNPIFSHYKFHKRVQAESQTVEQFVTDVKLLVRACSFKEPDEMIRDRIVLEQTLVRFTCVPPT